MKTLLCASVLGLAATLASAQSPSPAEITSLRQAWVTGANAKDAAAVAALYTDDATLMAPNAPTSKGRAAIQSSWKNLLDQGARDVVLTPVRGGTSGNMGFEAGTYSFTMGPAGAQGFTDKGKYLMTVKKGADGKWRIQDDMFNSDLPCPAK
jgi:uncharacterized protein (TIGR02246 family)